MAPRRNHQSSRFSGSPAISRISRGPIRSMSAKHGSTYWTEIRAGITTFLAMAYILPVNSGMLSIVIPGMKEQLVCATALSACFGCCLMGVLSNYPFMLAPGMGTNAFFTFSIILGRGLPWQAGLAAVFVASWIFILLSIIIGRGLPFVVRLFPTGVKDSIGAGVGLFLAFISFQSAEGMGISISDPATLVALNPLGAGEYDAAKIWLSLLVLVLTAALFIAKIPGAPLIGILFGTAVCWIEGAIRGEAGSVFGYPFGSNGDRNAPQFHVYVPQGVVATPTLAGLSGALWEGFGAAVDPETASTFWTAVATFCYTDFLDSSGTFLVVAKVAGLTDSRGHLPLARQNMAYLADGIAALVGSMLGVSTVTTYVESISGVADGAKTGLAAIVTGACFFLAIFFAPLFSAIPPLASGPILCLLGSLMFGSVRGIDWDDLEESLPAFLTIVTMPFTFGIGYGIIAGVVAWVVIQLLLVPHRMKQGVHPFVRFRALWNAAWIDGQEAAEDKTDVLVCADADAMPTGASAAQAEPDLV
ncbi:unnamed protein product [Polarella glacialis]|uniref:Uncharacterized protein n=1 Tax=Polarella glacialis TaxID=89957 RepID=A0A813EHT4_POLGL|nr:unnamed protein product [Polarella glacialis]